MMRASCNCRPSCKCKNCACGPYAIFFSTLGNETRLYVLRSLLGGPKSVMEIMRDTKTEQTLVSHSLRQLQSHGFVNSSKRGKFVIYSLNGSTIEPLLRLVDKHVKQYCTQGAKPCNCTRKGK